MGSVKTIKKKPPTYLPKNKKKVEKKKTKRKNTSREGKKW